MATDERIKGLETITGNLRASVSTLEGKFETLSKDMRDSNKTHWAMPIGVLLVLGWMGWLSTQVIRQGQKVTGIMFILSPQETLKSLTSSVSPEPQKAKKELVQVTDSFHKLTASKVSLPEQTVNDATAQLTTISTTHGNLPETWEAIGAFLTYRSQMIHGWQETNLPLCDSQFHKMPLTAPIDKNTNTLTHGPVEIHDCKIILDSPDMTNNLSFDLSLADVIFTHCVVFYNGGPIVLAPVKVATQQPPHFVGSAYFKDCQFVLSFGALPNQRGMEFVRELLASPTGDIKLEKAA